MAQLASLAGQAWLAEPGWLAPDQLSWIGWPGKASLAGPADLAGLVDPFQPGRTGQAGLDRAGPERAELPNLHGWPEQ